MRRVKIELRIEIMKDHITFYVTAVDGDESKTRDLDIT